MSKRLKICAAGMLVFGLSAAWAQDTTPPPPATDNPQQTEQPQESQGPVPAYGQQSAPPPITENPPISGLDLPSLEPHSAPISYIQPGATVSESADTNAANALGGGTNVTSITRALGSLTLHRLWSHYDLALDYVGGVGYYDISGQGFKDLQQADIDQKITWRRGQLSLRDSFSYLPDGNFGGAYGATGSQGIESLGSTAFSSFWGGTALGALGLTPRIMNVSLADVEESLTPKSSLTAAGGYAFTHFYGNDAADGASFFGGSQVAAQGGYSRIVSSHTQVAFVYGYQGFDFTEFGTAFHTHIIQLMYGHRISGRMDFLIAAGPQFTRLSIACTIVEVLAGNPNCTLSPTGTVQGSIPDTIIGLAGRARLRYNFARSSLDLTAERFETSGSGLFAGAETTLARLTYDRSLTRVWNAFADIGYSRNSRLQALSAAQQAECVYPGQSNPTGLPPCPGINADNYNYGFAGIGVHRAFGRAFHAYLSYQFNELSFDNSFCGGLPACNRISNREVVTFGLDWTPRPIRID
jgi:hypothetical protein